MLQTVQGYFQDNKFVPLQDAVIHNHVEVFVVFTNKPMPANDIVNEEDSLCANFPLFGCAKNKGGWISDDFDAPLEEMEEYM